MTKILFITSNRLGDAVLSTGVLTALHKRYPEAMFTVGCGAVPAPLFSAMPWVNKVITMKKSRWGGHWRRLWQQVWPTSWDMVVDLRSSGIAYFLRSKQKITLRKSYAATPKVRQLGALIGYDPPPAPTLYIPPSVQQDIAQQLGPRDHVVVLGVTAQWVGKVWPAARYIEVGRTLQARGWRLAIAASLDEKVMAEPVLEGLPLAQNWVGRFSVIEIAAALQGCRLFIGNDSGLMHLAAACGVPTLGLFGPSPAAIYAPWGAGNQIVETTTPYAQLIKLWQAQPNKVTTLMDSLSADKVTTAALAMLG